MDQHDVTRHSPSYMGKLRSNFIGTEFAFYDSGSSKGEGGSWGAGYHGKVVLDRTPAFHVNPYYRPDMLHSLL